MTIALSIKVYDGLVLASDSAATMIAPIGTGGGESVINVYNNANKIFNLHRGLAIGGMVWGAGSIGRASIATLAKDLRRRFEGRSRTHRSWEIDPEDFSIEEVAERTRVFLFDEHYKAQYKKEKDPKKKPSLGFMVAGYSPDSGFAEEWLIEIENGQCATPKAVRPAEECGWAAYAAAEPIRRLLLGHSPDLRRVLKDLGVPDNQLAPAMRVIRDELEVAVVVPPMPIQDVIDLADFLVKVSSMYYRYHPGAQIVGGPTDIAAITKHEGFKWVTRKYYYSREINPLRREITDEDHIRSGQTRKGGRRDGSGVRARSRKS